jgi:hypothetical protein
MSARLDAPGCRRTRRRARLGALVRAILRPRRGERACEHRPDWLDDDGLSFALVPRRPLGPRPGAGVIALEPPPDPPRGARPVPG